MCLTAVNNGRLVLNPGAEYLPIDNLPMVMLIIHVQMNAVRSHTAV